MCYFADGYLNESGTINTARLQVVLDEMGQWEQEIFEKEYADMNWYKGKQLKHVNEMEMGRKRSKLGMSPCFPQTVFELIFRQSVLTQPQRAIFDKVKAFALDNRNQSPPRDRHALLSMPNTFPARERKFITTLAEDLHLSVTWDDYDENDQNLVTWRFPGALEQQLPEPDEAQETNGDTEGEGEWEDVDDDDESEDEESNEAVDRVLKKYGKAQVVDDDEGGGFDARYEQSMKEKMDEWKRGYYKVLLLFLVCSGRKVYVLTTNVEGKLEILYDDPKDMGDLVFRYVEGLQWVMHYYYSGVASWGWFYDYHYAPRISGEYLRVCIFFWILMPSTDLKSVHKMSFDFPLGTPFRPYEQLMGVLPLASKDQIPSAYHVCISLSS